MPVRQFDQQCVGGWAVSERAQIQRGGLVCRKGAVTDVARPAQCVDGLRQQWQIEPRKQAERDVIFHRAALAVEGGLRLDK